MAMKCLACSQYHFRNEEPLIPTSFPDYLSQKVAANLSTWKIPLLKQVKSLHGNEQIVFHNICVYNTLKSFCSTQNA